MGWGGRQCGRRRRRGGSSPGPPWGSGASAAPPRAPHVLLWEELLGLAMYLRMGFRFRSSRASFSFLGPLLCWPGRGEKERGCWGGVGGAPARASLAAAPPLTFLALGKKGSHLSRSWAFSTTLAVRGSLGRIPTWLM